MTRLIDADALIKALDIGDLPIRLTYEINNAPTVDAVPVRQGKWISHGDCGVTECSCCGWNIEECVSWNYCPNCGARMDAE